MRAEVMPMTGLSPQLCQQVAVLCPSLIDQAGQASLPGCARLTEVLPAALARLRGGSTLDGGGRRIIPVRRAQAQCDAGLPGDPIVAAGGARRWQLALLDPLQDGIWRDAAESRHFTCAEQRIHNRGNIVWVLWPLSHKPTVGEFYLISAIMSRTVRVTNSRHVSPKVLYLLNIVIINRIDCSKRKDLTFFVF
jgi:hypothetical protein